MRLADDFPAIRARMGELHRERARAAFTEAWGTMPAAPTSSSLPLAEKRLLAPYMPRLIEQRRQGIWRPLGRLGGRG
jgi:hypothetical protein